MAAGDGFSVKTVTAAIDFKEQVIACCLIPSAPAHRFALAIACSRTFHGVIHGLRATGRAAVFLSLLPLPVRDCCVRVGVEPLIPLPRPPSLGPSR
jgi:hypothetical protein